MAEANVLCHRPAGMKSHMIVMIDMTTVATVIDIITGNPPPSSFLKKVQRKLPPPIFFNENKSITNIG
jgi:hypothetical protein